MSKIDVFWFGFSSGTLLTMLWGWALYVRPAKKDFDKLSGEISDRLDLLEGDFEMRYNCKLDGSSKD